MKIVTGRRGEDHISSNDFQALNQGIFGGGNYILNIGSKFAATLTSPTELRISDGDGVMQGVHFRILPGLLDTVELSPGILGLNRIDLVCARYEKDDVTGIENVSWYVVEGTPSSSTPVAPEVTTGDILGGDTMVDFPIFQVTFTGVTPELAKLWKYAVGETKLIEENIQLASDMGVYNFYEPIDAGLYCVSAYVTISRIAYEMTIRLQLSMTNPYPDNPSISSIRAYERLQSVRDVYCPLTATAVCGDGNVNLEVSLLTTLPEAISGYMSIIITRLA